MVAFNSKNNKYKTGSRCNLGKKKENHFDFRLLILFLSIFLVAGAIAVRLFFLQILNHNYYKDLSENQHFIFKNIVPVRGEIFLKDRDDIYPVAVNKDSKMAYAVPKEITDPYDAAQKISGALSLDEGDLRKKFESKEDMYEVLKHKLNDEEVVNVNNLKLKGIHLSQENFRYYPAEELASHVLGFVGWKGDDFGGRYGIENYFNKELIGEAGNIFQNKDNSGGWISTGIRDITPAKNGNGLILTIDHIIQYETEKILKSTVEKFEARRGTIIVMEPETGRIRAMANYPNFNPNEYKDGSMENFRNLAVGDAYECGSVFKPITMVSALDNNKVSPSSTYVDTGRVAEAGYVMQNSDLKSYGVQTMTQVLEKSLNTGVIHAEKLLGNENFFEYVKRFGFGVETGIDLPGESAGNISNLKNIKANINFFTASFGQGITVTPLQLTTAYNAIANGGMLMKPQIVEKIIHNENDFEEVKPKEIRKVISQRAANEISQMLMSVVVNGHGKQAGVPGYKVGGKTGTAQVASLNSRGYEEGKNIGSFIGFAPLDNPKFTVLVRIDEPKGLQWAESSAAPAFGELMKFLLEYKNIKPTEEYTQEDLDKFKMNHTLNEYFVQKEKEKEEEKNNQEDNNIKENEKEAETGAEKL